MAQQVAEGELRPEVVGAAGELRQLVGQRRVEVQAPSAARTIARVAVKDVVIEPMAKAESRVTARPVPCSSSPTSTDTVSPSRWIAS